MSLLGPTGAASSVPPLNPVTVQFAGPSGTHITVSAANPLPVSGAGGTGAGATGPTGPAGVASATGATGPIGPTGAPSGGGAFTTSVYTSNAAVLNLPATNNLLTIARQGTPAPLTVNLPYLPATNLMVGIKDGGNLFGNNPATVKTTDGTQIDRNAGTTGYLMQQNDGQNWFIFDGVRWNVGLIWLLMMLALPAAAAEQPILACAQGEMPEICSLKIQRNNALDELAISDSKRHREQQYWELYLDGMENQRKQIDAWWRSYRGDAQESANHLGGGGRKEKRR